VLVSAAAIVCFSVASVSAGQDVSLSPPPTALTQQPKPVPQPGNPTQEIAREQPEGTALTVGPARIRLGKYKETREARLALSVTLS
jgi:hypothetical protein